MNIPNGAVEPGPAYGELAAKIAVFGDVEWSFHQLPRNALWRRLELHRGNLSSHSHIFMALSTAVHTLAIKSVGSCSHVPNPGDIISNTSQP
jgi:hypothetical protein